MHRYGIVLIIHVRSTWFVAYPGVFLSHTHNPVEFLLGLLSLSVCLHVFMKQLDFWMNFHKI
jgi:hypothetical protein